MKNEPCSAFVSGVASHAYLLPGLTCIARGAATSGRVREEADPFRDDEAYVQGVQGREFLERRLLTNERKATPLCSGHLHAKSGGGGGANSPAKASAYRRVRRRRPLHNKRLREGATYKRLRRWLRASRAQRLRRRMPGCPMKRLPHSKV